MPKKKTIKQIAEPASKQPYKKGLNRQRKSKHGKAGYKKEYAQEAFELLSESDTAKNKAHLCAYFVVTRSTINAWIKRHSEFKEAVEKGLNISEAKWRDKLAKYAFKPAGAVNNGLIKMLSGNVYGIRDETNPSIILQQNQEQHTTIKAQGTNLHEIEKAMQRRGIPLPDIGTDDIPSGEENE